MAVILSLCFEIQITQLEQNDEWDKSQHYWDICLSSYAVRS